MLAHAFSSTTRPANEVYRVGARVPGDWFVLQVIVGIPLPTGQNLAMGYDNWTETIEGWIEEKEYYYHTYPSTSVFSHYTQVRMPQESSQTAMFVCRLDDLAFIGYDWLWRDDVSFVRTEQYVMVFLRLQLHPRVKR